MTVPPIPCNGYNANGRIDNSDNPLIVRMWNSSVPSCAWFITAHCEDDISLDVYIRLQAMFPDCVYVYCAYCRQDVMHLHAVVATCNEYSRRAAGTRVMNVFRNVARDVGTTIANVMLCPVYRGVDNCRDYIRNQRDDRASVHEHALGDPNVMHSYGNAWHREFSHRRYAGISRYDIIDWCSNGFPPYCAAHPDNTRFHHSAMAAMAQFVRNLRGGTRGRGYFFASVRYIEHRNGDRREPIEVCERILSGYFGSDSLASRPFVWSIRGNNVIESFATHAMPGYSAQPGIVLFVQSGGNARTASAIQATINAARARNGPYANLEVLCVAYCE